jgi:hypothetical protein
MAGMPSPPEVDNDISGFLEYPRNFFGEKDGSNPTTNNDASRLWQFQKIDLPREPLTQNYQMVTK